MPYANIKITREGVTPEQKRRLIRSATDLSIDVLGKNPKFHRLPKLSCRGCKPGHAETSTKGAAA